MFGFGLASHPRWRFCVIVAALLKRALQSPQFQHQCFALWPRCVLRRIRFRNVAVPVIDRHHCGTPPLAPAWVSALAIFGLSGVTERTEDLAADLVAAPACDLATRAKISSRGPNAIMRPS